MSSLRDRPADRSGDGMLDALTALLVERPDASLAELAQGVGVGRTTLHRRFPTREDVLRAVAVHALERLAAAYEDARLEAAFVVEGLPARDEVSAVRDGHAAFRRVVEHLIPAGPSLTFLLRAHELDDDDELDRLTRAVDAPLVGAIERAHGLGVLSGRFSAQWLLESLYALVYIAWEQIDRGSLAPRDGADLVLDTWLNGAAPR